MLRKFSMRVASLTLTFIIRRIIINVGELVSKLTKFRWLFLMKFLIYWALNYSKVVLYNRNAFIKKPKTSLAMRVKHQLWLYRKPFWWQHFWLLQFLKRPRPQNTETNTCYCVYYIKGYKRNLLNPSAEFSTASALTRYIDVTQLLNPTITDILRHSKSPDFHIACTVLFYF